MILFLTKNWNNSKVMFVIILGKSKFSMEPSQNGNQACRLFVPKLTNLRTRLNTEDKVFTDFLSKCLKLDPSVRFSAKEALQHPFLNS